MTHFLADARYLASVRHKRTIIVFNKVPWSDEAIERWATADATDEISFAA